MLVTSSGDPLPVHSILLKARSPYFRVLLSSKWKAGRETRLEVGKEALTLIITFLYSSKLHLEGLAVELLFEVLDNARMMGITDLEKEIEDFIILNLVAKKIIMCWDKPTQRCANSCFVPNFDGSPCLIINL